MATVSMEHQGGAMHLSKARDVVCGIHPRTFQGQGAPYSSRRAARKDPSSSLWSGRNPTALSSRGGTIQLSPVGEEPYSSLQTVRNPTALSGRGGTLQLSPDGEEPYSSLRSGRNPTALSRR